VDNRTHGATLYGATAWEKATVVLGKVAHFSLLLGLPWALHGPGATLAAFLAYSVTQVGLGTGGGGDAPRARPAHPPRPAYPAAAPRRSPPRAPPTTPPPTAPPPRPPAPPPALPPHRAVRRPRGHVCGEP
jgi:hypothetical protein